MNARGWLEDGVDLALVGAVALWIGIAGAFLASFTPTRGEYAAAQNSPAPGGAEAGPLLPAEPAAGRADSPADELPAGLLDRLAALESGGDDAAVNAAEDAHGRWQVRAGYLADGNAEAGTSYGLDEMHDPAKAERIVRAYLSRYGRAFAARAGRAPTAEELARIHNGGPRGRNRPARSPMPAHSRRRKGARGETKTMPFLRAQAENRLHVFRGHRPCVFRELRKQALRSESMHERADEQGVRGRNVEQASEFRR